MLCRILEQKAEESQGAGTEGEVEEDVENLTKDASIGRGCKKQATDTFILTSCWLCFQCFKKMNQFKIF